MLRWEQAVLAEKAGVSIETIKRLERLDGPLRATRVATLDVIQRALEAAGVEFIPENGGGAGVRLRHRTRSVNEGLRPDEHSA